MPKRLFLIDAMAQIYRAHFAFVRSPLYTSKGENVSAVFGFTNILMGLLAREKPDAIAIVYDSPAATFRHHIYPEYKATREKMPEDLVAQLPRLDQVIEALGLNKVILPGYEADDLVGTIARMGEVKGYEVFLVTGDKDYYQLVTPNVKMYNPKRGLDNPEIFDPEGVEKVFGVPPERVIDVLALAGDTSDNVPGVPNVGPKTAIKLLKQYGDMEAALNDWENIGGKLGENLNTYREQAILSKNLVTIRTNAPVDVELDDLVFTAYNNDKLRDLFMELEFKSLMRFLDEEPKTMDEQQSGVEYKTVDTEPKLKTLLKELEKSSHFAFDTETTSTDPTRAILIGMSFSTRPGNGWYVPINYFRWDGDAKVPVGGYSVSDCDKRAPKIVEKFRSVLASGPKKIIQHAKYDMLVIKRYGVMVGPVGFDPMIADYLLNPVARGHGIDNMALNYLKIKKIETSELIGKGKSQVTMDRVPLELITKYACEDADVALRLATELEPRIKGKGLDDLLYEVELPLSDVLMEMEGNGISLDVPLLKEMSVELKEKMADLQDECWELAGERFNLNSPKQLGHILFEKMNLPTSMTKKTKTGYSTDQKVLERLAPLDPLPKKILEFRKYQKLVSTYIDALPELVNPETGRVHTTYSQVVASTGRLSSNNPNLQNIPIRSEQGAEIRKAFVAEEGHVLISADYSQVELRMMAHLSEDEGMIAAFERGDDIHQATAAKIFQLDPRDVDKKIRSQAKEVNFGVLFGMREFGLSSRLGISRQEAKEFIDGYFGAFPKVAKYIEGLLDQARKDGYVSTLLGHQRPVPELHSSNQNVRQAAERVTIATAVQGSAADLIKVAMIKMHADMKRKKLPYKILLQVHDELILEVQEDKVEDAKAWAKEKMESAMKLRVPLIVDAGHGTNWLEAH